MPDRLDRRADHGLTPGVVDLGRLRLYRGSDRKLGRQTVRIAGNLDLARRPHKFPDRLGNYWRSRRAGPAAAAGQIALAPMGLRDGR